MQHAPQTREVPLCSLCSVVQNQLKNKTYRSNQSNLDHQPPTTTHMCISGDSEGALDDKSTEIATGVNGGDKEKWGDCMGVCAVKGGGEQILTVK
jgi:hypothetical protein